MKTAQTKRLKQVCDNLIIEGAVRNLTEMSIALGYKSRASFLNILSGTFPVSDKLLKKISLLYPSVDVEWIKTGKKNGTKETLRNIDRFQSFLYAENITIEEACERLGWSKFSFYKARQTELTNEQIEAIGKCFETLNIKWLKTGSGNMLNIKQENLMAQIQKLQRDYRVLQNEVKLLSKKVSQLSKKQ